MGGSHIEHEFFAYFCRLFLDAVRSLIAGMVAERGGSRAGAGRELSTRTVGGADAPCEGVEKYVRDVGGLLHAVRLTMGDSGGLAQRRLVALGARRDRNDLDRPLRVVVLSQARQHLGR